MRSATTLRLVLGALCLAAPGRVLAAARGSGRRPAMVVRVLGARLLLQGGLDLTVGTRTRLPDAAIEAAHAASMVSLAAIRPAYRGPALTSAAVATSLALLDLVGSPRRSVRAGR
jgi:hypothetical protein